MRPYRRRSTFRRRRGRPYGGYRKYRGLRKRITRKRWARTRIVKQTKTFRNEFDVVQVHNAFLHGYLNIALRDIEPMADPSWRTNWQFYRLNTVKFTFKPNLGNNAPIDSNAAYDTPLVVWYDPREDYSPSPSVDQGMQVPGNIMLQPWETKSITVKPAVTCPVHWDGSIPPKPDAFYIRKSPWINTRYDFVEHLAATLAIDPYTGTFGARWSIYVTVNYQFKGQR